MPWHGWGRPAFYDYQLDNARKFITRMNQRDLRSWKATKSNEWLAGQCVMRYKAVVRFDSHGKETNQLIEFGAMPVRLPWRDEELRLVVVKGFGRKPMMLLTNLAVNEVPEFFLCALAAGIKRAFVRYGNWETKAAVKKKDDRQPTLPGWDELSHLGVG